MYQIQGNNINEIQTEIYRILSKKGSLITVRNQKTLELYPLMIRLTNINNRCTTIKNRNWNLVFAIGEFAWHMAGSECLDFINYYSSNWRKISDDGLLISESCYGSKLFHQSSNWTSLINELRLDRYSRRAVINLYDSESLGLKKLDVACTVSLQFLIRNNKLDLITTMRSNDLVWGLPNDIFFFTMLQEILALELGIDKGDYYHQVASLHIYEKHFNLMEAINSDPVFFEFEMPEMSDIVTLKEFVEKESIIRNTSNIDISLDSIYWNNLLSILKLKAIEYSDLIFNQILLSSPYKDVLKLCPQKYFE
ncbi:MAG: thymidylate synthase [Bacteroidetes bacterium]|nr:thymidylate synthase [Bacteroidota bacterium]